MKKIVRLTESDLNRIVKRAIMESDQLHMYNGFKINYDFSKLGTSTGTWKGNPNGTIELYMDGDFYMFTLEGLSYSGK
jgi:hypothetical protein